MIPSTSLSIIPTLSPIPFYSITCSSSPSTSSSSFLYPFLVSFKVSNFSSRKPKPIDLSCKQNCFTEFQRLKKGERNKGCFLVRAESNNDMTISEVREEDEENPPPFLDYDTISRPRRIALFVEPSPFAWVLITLLNFTSSWKIMGLMLVSCIVWWILGSVTKRWLWFSLIALCLMKRLWQFQVIISMLFSRLHLLILF